ncbi:MAG: photosystem II reaction center PsbP family protein [Puniceicoccales bacterium]|jgi:hypothetical protein|nr:photosystem II reaction center PsbP family protein [Puniceicoccales bacterium]
MRLKYVLPLIACLALISACAPQASSSLVFPDAGFSIEPLRSKEAPEKALMMFLPRRDGFAASVNVTTMEWDTPITEYAAEAKKQISDIKGTIVSEKQVSIAEWTIEYQADLGNGLMRFYTRAIFSGGKIYTATATSLDKHWAEDSAALTQCVNTLKPGVPARK